MLIVIKKINNTNNNNDIYIYINNWYSIPISVIDLCGDIFSKIIEYLLNGGGGPLLWEVFSQIHFFQEELYPPLYTFFWVKLVHLL